MTALPLRIVRGLLRRIHRRLSTPYVERAKESFDAAKLQRAEQALRALPAPNGDARAYLEKHIPRLARTLALVPTAPDNGRALELGCYMQITPFLQRLCGYQEVRGAYFGELGRTDHKLLHFPDRDFTCDVDHFNAELDRFPYPDDHYDLIVVGEIIEHLTSDPMHMLLECRRVLRDGGFLLVTTPNVGSITSVAKTLDGRDNPQIYFLYKRTAPGVPPEIGHVREYTAYELGEIVKSAGFEIQQLFTTFIEEFATHQPLLALLEEHDYNTENRGEQSWCLAVKRATLPIDRFPFFVYES